MTQPTAVPLVPLDALHAGESGCVAELDGPAVAISRLQELGLSVGRQLTMLRPGLPCLVQLGELRLCLRPEAGVVVLIGLNQD